ALTRSRLSRMDASGNPTVVKVGRPLARSTSTSIIQASTPSKVLLSTLASTAVPFFRLPAPYPLQEREKENCFYVSSGTTQTLKNLSAGVKRDSNPPRDKSTIGQVMIQHTQSGTITSHLTALLPLHRPA